MAAQTGEAFAVTNSAGSLVQIGFAAAVNFNPVGYVVSRLQVRAGSVAFFTAEGWVNFAVTDQAICHARESCGRSLIGLLQPTMASSAGVRLLQMEQKIAGGRQVGAAAHCGLEDGSDIAQAKVQFMVETCQQRLPLGLDDGRRGQRRRRASLPVAAQANLG
jgi:hypothetical protein